MDDHPAQYAELISRLFSMATARCEDGATIAVECQGRRTQQQGLDGAGELLSLADELTTLGRSIVALLSGPADVQS